MENNKSIIKKIKSLLAKTVENGASKAESIAAIAHASRLMKKYNIEQGDLNRFNKFDLVAITNDSSLSKNLKSLFGGNLGSLFDAKCSASRHTISFYGFREDVELCHFFYKTITSSCERELKEYRKSDYYKKVIAYKGSGTARSLSYSFRVGFFMEVGGRIEEMYKARKQEIKNETAYGLVLVDKSKKVEEGFRLEAKGMTSHKPKVERVCKDSYTAGLKKGNKVIIQQAI